MPTHPPNTICERCGRIRNDAAHEPSSICNQVLDPGCKSYLEFKADPEGAKARHYRQMDPRFSR